MNATGAYSSLLLLATPFNLAIGAESKKVKLRYSKIPRIGKYHMVRIRNIRNVRIQPGPDTYPDSKSEKQGGVS